MKLSYPPLKAALMNILVLCTGNSARSILLECILNRLGQDRLQAFSAGSKPTGKVNPHAETLLLDLGYEIDRLASKSWDSFAEADAPLIDLVITACDNAAGETCPLFSGPATKVHWGIPDPAAADEAEIEGAFAEAYDRLYEFAQKLLALDLERLSAGELRDQAQAIRGFVTA